MGRWTSDDHQLTARWLRCAGWSDVCGHIKISQHRSADRVETHSGKHQGLYIEFVGNFQILVVDHTVNEFEIVVQNVVAASHTEESKDT